VAASAVDRALDGAAALCLCISTSLSSPAGEIIVLWPADDLPIRYPSVAAGVIAALVRQTDGTACRLAR
jgi:hypothetical protein